MRSHATRLRGRRRFAPTATRTVAATSSTSSTTSPRNAATSSRRLVRCSTTTHSSPAELCGADAFDYLVALLRHHRELCENPRAWTPWRYAETLAGLAAAPGPLP